MVKTVKQSRYKQQKKQPRKKVDMVSIAKYFMLWISFAVISFLVKALVLGALKQSPTGECGNGTLTLLEVHNTGAAFNLFAGHPEMIIISSFFIAAILTFIVLISSARLSHNAISSMAFLSAGITMNMIERIRLGYVIDYIQCNFLNDFPVFNVSDMMIVAGAIGLILSILFVKKQD